MMKSWKRYAAALILNAAITLFVLYIRGGGLKIYYVDAFSVAGSVSILLGLLFWVTSAGAFDMVGYGFSSFRGTGKYKDLYDYSVRKREKRKRQGKTFLPYIFVGIGFVGISFLISVLWKV